jgi:CRP/FNR family cyclic AMP-dependent transcriptional regulator
MGISMQASDKAGARLPNLGDAELRVLSAHAATKSFPKNTVIVNEGDETDSLYVILSGRVKVYVSDEAGKEIVLATHETGEYFGEMVLDEGPRSASVMTLEPSQFAIVPKSQFKAFMFDNPQFAIHLIEKLIHRVRALTDNVKSLALMDVYGRVARLLLELAREQDGKLEVDEKLTQQDIADRVGASREMISKILKDLADGGYISVAHKRITIHRKPPRQW